MCYSFQIVQFASFAAAQKISSGNYRTSRTEAQSRPALRAFLVEISLRHTGDFSTVRILDCERLTNPIFSGTTTAAYWPSAASISIYEFLMKSRHDVLTSALSQFKTSNTLVPFYGCFPNKGNLPIRERGMSWAKQSFKLSLLPRQLFPPHRPRSRSANVLPLANQPHVPSLSPSSRMDR